jgi:hypothetical protein
MNEAIEAESEAEFGMRLLRTRTSYSLRVNMTSPRIASSTTRDAAAITSRRGVTEDIRNASTA